MATPNDQTPDQALSVEQLRALLQKQSAALADMDLRVKNILHSIPLGLLAVNTTRNTIELSNKLSQNLFGYDAREMRGKPVDFIFPDIRRFDVSPGSNPIHTSAKKKGGETFPVEIYVNEYDREMIFVHVQDITERLRLQDLRQQLLTMVSHDLRAPLTSIRMQIAMLVENRYGELPAKAQQTAQKIEANTDLMISLVNDLLDSERISIGDFELEIDNVTNGEIVNQAIEVCRGLAERGQIILQGKADNTVLRGDKDRLTRVLFNLVGNAIKYSPQGETVKVDSKLEGTNVVFSVSDRGPGVPEHLRLAIFERYRQLEQSQTTKKKGIGLGLYIAKSLVERHGGNIWVESNSGAGSTFYFTVPI